MRHLGLSGGGLRLSAHSYSIPAKTNSVRLSCLILSPPKRSSTVSKSPSPIGSRPFSVLPVVETGIVTAQHLFSGLHILTGTPWYLTIPLIALSLNLVGRLPITIYTRRVAQRRATLAPIIRAWYARHVRDVTGAGTASGDLKKQVETRFRQTSKRIYREWSVQRWKDFSFFGILPLWLTSIEAMRRLAGTSKGLLGSIFSGPGSSADTVQAVQAVQDAPHDTAAPVEALGADQGVADALTVTGADPTLATEGCLWFPDLTVADPYHVLPFVLSVVLLARLLPRNRQGFAMLFGTKMPASSTQVQIYGRPLHRALLLLALLVGPATMNLPAAVHLYWISSALITNVQSDVISKIMKLPKSEGHLCRGKEPTLIVPAPPQQQS